MTAFLALLIALSVPNWHDVSANIPDDQLQASLLVDHLALRPGQTTTIAVVLGMLPGWHVYYDGQNDSGLPVTVELELPEGFVAGPLQWPTPKRHVAPGDLLDHVYETELVLLSEGDGTRNAAPSVALPLRAKVAWLVCTDEECKQGGATVTVEVAIRATEAPEPARSPAAERIERARAALPKPLADAGNSIRLSWSDHGVAFIGEGVQRWTFHPRASSTLVAALLADGESVGDRLGLKFSLAPRGRGGVSGILEVRGPAPQTARAFRVDAAEPPLPTNR